MNNLNNILYYNAGQIATIVLHVVNDALDSIKLNNPVISCIYAPNQKQLSSYLFPLPFYELESCVYIAKFQLPKTIKDTGTYICSVEWSIGDKKYKSIYSIIVGIPIGNPSASGA